MKYLLGAAALISCLILVSFDTFTGSVFKNVACWGVAMSILYMVLSAVDRSDSATS